MRDINVIDAVRVKIVYRILEIIIRLNSVQRQELKNLADDSIWYGSEESPITINSTNDTDLKRSFNRFPKHFNPERLFVCELSKPLILGPNGEIATSDGKLILETIDVDDIQSFVWLGRFRTTRNRFMKQMLYRPDYNKFDGEYFPLICSDPSYYHWITECLSKLQSLKIYEKNTGNHPTILIENQPRSFVIEGLNLAGYDSSRWREIGPYECSIVDKAIIPMRRSHLFNYNSPSKSPYSPSREDLLWLKNTMRSKCKFDDERNRRIYISRQGASRGRNVRNFGDLSILLNEYEFEIYSLENIKFQRQVELFSEAGIILGPTGAGLVNMIFSDDPQVIELVPRSQLYPSPQIGPYFYNLSELMGFDYNGIPTDDENDELIVDIELLNSELSKYIK